METCYTLLTRGEQLTANKTGAPVDERLRIRAVTMNNLGCYYKKKGRLRSALKCLNKVQSTTNALIVTRGQALKIESRLKECKNPADTHLNICACQSQLGRHNEALEHAQAALILLQVSSSGLLGIRLKWCDRTSCFPLEVAGTSRPPLKRGSL